MIEVLLYKNTSDWDVRDKNLTSLGSVQGEFIDGGGMLAPVIQFVSTTRPTFNYCNIPYFGRYYKVDGDIIPMGDNIWQCKLKHDSLMNLWDQVKNQTALIDRQENSFNPYLPDGEAPIEADSVFTVLKFPMGNFGTRNNLVMINSAAIPDL